MRFTIVDLLILVFASVVCAQQAPRVSVTKIHPRSLAVPLANTLRRGPISFLAPQGEGARFDFPSDKSSLFAKDRVEIWLAADPDPVLPPIGWGNLELSRRLAKLLQGRCAGEMRI
jgi:hypothetical protein